MEKCAICGRFESESKTVLEAHESACKTAWRRRAWKGGALVLAGAVALSALIWRLTR